MIILLTDFGQSEYVGVMKAVIYSINKDAKIVDLCHDISPQKTIEASWVLKNNYKYFPEGATFCCVVDPGVGTERKALAVKTTGYYFVAPDNGLLWETLKENAERTKNNRYKRGSNPSGCEQHISRPGRFRKGSRKYCSGSF